MELSSTAGGSVNGENCLENSEASPGKTEQVSFNLVVSVYRETPVLKY